MQQLTILYDSRCGICCRATDWLAAQHTYVRLRFLPAGFGQARKAFPDLDHEATGEVLHVVADDGRVWRGARAWLMCLWAVRRTRSLSLRLASPTSMAIAERVVQRMSRGRLRLSEILGWEAQVKAGGAEQAADPEASGASCGTGECGEQGSP